MGITDKDQADLFVHHIASDWRQAGLNPADQSLCRYAEKLTGAPASISESDIAALRENGFDDLAIHDATQVIAYFNYINRIADALGVDNETFIRPWEKSPNK